MLRKLSKQLSGEDWTWNNLNTLCWAIGSISGSMMEEQVLWTTQYPLLLLKRNPTRVAEGWKIQSLRSYQKYFFNS